MFFLCVFNLGLTFAELFLRVNPLEKLAAGGITQRFDPLLPMEPGRTVESIVLEGCPVRSG